MPKNGLNVSLNSYDDIFSTEETRQEEQREQVQQIPIDDTSLLLCYNPAQVLKMAGKRYLTGPVILVRTNMDGNFISLTIDDVYRFQKFLASHSVTLMADDQKLPCICIV